MLSAEPPSVYSIATTLKHVMMPKTYVKTAYPDIEQDYPMFVAPNRLLIDNAMEHVGVSLRDAAEDTPA